MKGIKQIPATVSDWLRSSTAAVTAEFRSTLLNDAELVADRAKLRRKMLAAGSKRRPPVKQTKYRIHLSKIINMV